MTPASGRGRPASAAKRSMRSTRSRTSRRGIRPGIQPSQYSTARRAAALLFPPYQMGMASGRPGTGLMATSWKR